MRDSVIRQRRANTDREVPWSAEETSPRRSWAPWLVAETIRRAGIEPAIVDECIMGNVVSAGAGAESRSPGRPAEAAWPTTSPRSPSTRFVDPA